MRRPPNAAVEGDHFALDGNKAAIRIWFAKDKGPVKLVSTIHGVEQVFELK